jgi:hypothetical protein
MLLSKRLFLLLLLWVTPNHEIHYCGLYSLNLTKDRIHIHFDFNHEISSYYRNNNNKNRKRVACIGV